MNMADFSFSCTLGSRCMAMRLARFFVGSLTVYSMAVGQIWPSTKHSKNKKL